MELELESSPEHRPTVPQSKFMPIAWGFILLAWMAVLCFVPDPRPLGAPQWSVDLTQALAGLSEPASRVIATVVLRGIGIAMVGVLLSLCLTQIPLRYAAPIVLLGSIVLAIGSQWVNYGYFPISQQLQLSIVAAITGSLCGFILRRNRASLVVLALLMSGLFIYGTSTGISDDLYDSARATGQHILDQADDLPEGDEGFLEILRLAFSFAEDNSHGTDATQPNKAAILALGVILGEERIAQVANRPIEFGNRKEFRKIRQRITIRSRNDLARHFWVSAALVVLSDESRSMTVGITKEMMDATEGGSGFSFVDLTADRAGTLFAVVATRDSRSARNLQRTIRDGIRVEDLFPPIDGLPEGLTRDVFQNEFGGLGGTKTTELVEEIRKRLEKCFVLECDQ